MRERPTTTWGSVVLLLCILAAGWFASYFWGGHSSSSQSKPEAPEAILIHLVWNANDPAEQTTGYKVYEMYYDGHTVNPWALRQIVTSPQWTGTSGAGLHLWAVTSVNALRESSKSQIVRTGNL